MEKIHYDLAMKKCLLSVSLDSLDLKKKLEKECIVRRWYSYKTMRMHLFFP